MDTIREHMAVQGSDGEHVGTVDRVEGALIKLTRNDAASGGEHHHIPLDWVSSVDTVVHLSKTGEQARQEWLSTENTGAA